MAVMNPLTHSHMPLYVRGRLKISQFLLLFETIACSIKNSLYLPVVSLYIIVLSA